METGRALKQTINSQKMFLTVFSLAMLSFLYFRLDNGTTQLIEDPEQLTKERINLFVKYSEFITALVLSFYTVNTVSKGKWFNNNQTEENQNNHNGPE